MTKSPGRHHTTDPKSYTYPVDSTSLHSVSQNENIYLQCIPAVQEPVTKSPGPVTKSPGTLRETLYVLGTGRVPSGRVSMSTISVQGTEPILGTLVKNKRPSLKIGAFSKNWNEKRVYFSNFGGTPQPKSGQVLPQWRSQGRV